MLPELLLVALMSTDVLRVRGTESGFNSCRQAVLQVPYTTIPFDCDGEFAYLFVRLTDGRKLGGISLSNCRWRDSVFVNGMERVPCTDDGRSPASICPAFP